MRKFALIIFASALLASCGGNSESTENATTDSTSVVCDSSNTVCADTCKVDTSVVNTTTVK